MFKKTVFRGFCRGLRCKLFASVVCFLSVFGTAFAYDFWVKIDGESPTFSFSISASGEFTVNCGNDVNDALSSNLDPDIWQENVAGDYNIHRTFNTTNTTYTCNYSSFGNGPKYVRFGGNAAGYDYSSYVYDSNTSQQFPAIKFDDAYQITEIGGDLTAIFNHISSGSCNPSYNGNTCYPSFSGTFEGAEITQIPSGLFASLSSSNWSGYPHYMFYQTFKDCVHLVSVPDGLFSYISRSGEYMFYGTFYGCSGLTSIPSNLFAHFSEPKAHMFERTFMYDSDLSSTGVPNENYISPTLFHQNMQIQNAAYFMTDIFTSVNGLAYECPANYYQYVTGYESYWNSFVSCLPCPPGTHSEAGSTSLNDCLCNNLSSTAPEVYLLGYPLSDPTGTAINNAMSDSGGVMSSYIDFSYGDVYVDGTCSVTPGGMDIFGIPDTTQPGPYCWCRVTRFDADGGQSSSFADGDSYWVFHNYGTSCSAAACESDCEEMTSANGSSLLRQSLYTTYHCPVYYGLEYNCNNDTDPRPTINTGNHSTYVRPAGSTFQLPDPNLPCNTLNGYSIIGWYCGNYEHDGDFNDINTYVDFSVANTNPYAITSMDTPNVFGDEYHPSVRMSGSFVLNQNTVCRAIWQKDPTCPAYILGVASGDSNAENINNNGTYGASGVSADVVQFINQASQMDYQIRFETIASSTYGLMNIDGNPSLNSSGDNCWCRVTYYDQDGTGNFQTLNDMPWVFAGIRNGNNNNCSALCGNEFATSSRFRTTAYTTNVCPQNYTISYDCGMGNGGPLSSTTTNELNYTLGHTASECGTPTNPNCYLDTTAGTNVSGDAWSCTPNGGNQSDYLTTSSGTLPVASNYTCTAQWYCCLSGQILNSAGNGCVARKIQLEWDSNGGTSVNNSSLCSYGSTTNPGNINNINQPSKPGYSFKAWLVKRWRSCSFFGANPSLSSGQYCAENADSTCYKNDIMINCSDFLFDDLTPGQWKARFNYGTIYGLAQCSVTGGGLGETKNTIDSSVGGNCWCAASSYSPNPTENTGDACTFDSPVWILLAPDGTVESCNQGCAKICAGTLGVGNLDFRKLFFDAY